MVESVSSTRDTYYSVHTHKILTYVYTTVRNLNIYGDSCDADIMHLSDSESLPGLLEAGDDLFPVRHRQGPGTASRICMEPKMKLNQKWIFNLDFGC